MDLPAPITVLLADDQRAYREGLARAITEHRGLDLVAVARDGDEAFEAIENLAPDVALVDVRMSGMEGTTLCAELRRRHPDIATRVILMSAHEGAALAQHARESGADGYVPKDHSRREICEVLVQASQRDRAPAGLGPAAVHWTCLSPG